MGATPNVIKCSIETKHHRAKNLSVNHRVVSTSALLLTESYWFVHHTQWEQLVLLTRCFVYNLNDKNRTKTLSKTPPVDEQLCQRMTFPAKWLITSTWLFFVFNNSHLFYYYSCQQELDSICWGGSPTRWNMQSRQFFKWTFRFFSREPTDQIAEPICTHNGLRDAV
jgi:hypothetical protein